LFDPRTGTFTETGSMTTKRSCHTATLLKNGLVLLAGGDDQGTGSAELFDPKAGTFNPTGPMSSERFSATATLLASGDVLVAGGYTSAGLAGALASAELYDPNTGTFRRTGSMMTPRGGHTATSLPDGRVLMAGGELATEVLNSAELFDPKTGGFTATGSMNMTRSWATGTLLADGSVLIAGGWANTATTDDTNTAETYGPGAGTFTSIGSLVEARSNHTATTLTDGRILLAGGSDTGNADALATSEMYVP
jgi:hypothetical protein